MYGDQKGYFRNMKPKGLKEEVDATVQSVANAISFSEARRMSPAAKARKDALRDIGKDKSKDDDEQSFLSCLSESKEKKRNCRTLKELLQTKPKSQIQKEHKFNSKQEAQIETQGQEEKEYENQNNQNHQRDEMDKDLLLAYLQID